MIGSTEIGQSVVLIAEEDHLGSKSGEQGIIVDSFCYHWCC